VNELDELRAANPLAVDDVAGERDGEPARALHTAITATLPDPPRRRRARWPRLAVAAVLALAAALALVLVRGGGDDDRAEAIVLERAARWIERPATGVLHLRWEIRQDGMDGVIDQETWQDLARPSSSRRRVGPFQGRPTHEVILDATSVAVYDPATARLTRWPLEEPLVGIEDPLHGVRTALARGQAELDGTGVIDGIDCDRVRMYGTEERDPEQSYSILYIDRKTGRPVAIEDSSGHGIAYRYRIYEVLPDTPANRALTGAQAHPDATVVELAEPDWELWTRFEGHG
jgi:hypothetical protein